jgi:hypothetical protein
MKLNCSYENTVHLKLLWQRCHLLVVKDHWSSRRFVRWESVRKWLAR